MATTGDKAIGIILLVIIVIMAFFGLAPFMMRGFHFFSGMGEGANIGYGIPNFVRFIPMTILPLALLVLWVLVIVWVYRDAERRGNSGVLWALLVFVGNIIGLLIYLIVRNDSAPVAASLETTIACSNCGKQVAQKYAFCPHCGVQLKSTCPSCGEGISSDWQVCPYCGEKLAKK